MCDRRCWIRLLSVLLVILLEDNCSAQARRDPTTSLSKTNDGALPGTSLLTTKEPLDEVMIAGLRRFCLRELSKAKDNRAARREADAITDEKNTTLRDRFRTLIGVVDPRVTQSATAGHRFELLSTVERSSVVATCDGVTVHTVRWPVLTGVSAEGLLLVPENPRSGVVVLPDADWSPEALCGLEGDLSESTQFVRRLAASGSLVAIPTLISRSDEHSGHPRVGYTNQPHREFIQRQAFEVGRHIVGYEVQKTLAAVDLLEQFANRDAKSTSRGLFPIGVAGIGEGGLLALYSAAIDSRIQSCLVSGYFQEREGVWQEPIYRDVWGLLTEFGDADLAGLVAPRRLVIEACGVPLVAGPPPGRNGRRESAAPGRIAAIDLGSVEREYNLAQGFYERAGKSQELILAQSGETGQNSPGSESAIRQFAAGLGIVVRFDAPLRPWRRDVVAQSEVSLFDSSARQRRQMDELQVHVQSVLRQGHQTRDGKWRVNWNTVAEWEQSRGALRDWVHDELIGRLPVSPQPVKPRSRVVLETDAYTGYEVVLDVADDVIAAGILLLPKDLKPGEKRPLVVCQHGLEGVPMDTISRDPKPFGYYKAFADELARRGFLVFAPQNPCRGGENFRVLQRMSHPLQRTLFSYIIAQHATTLDWLATLDCVDARRIGFYGLSYGGKTAMRVPPLVDGYCLSICSGDFTDWVRTIASNEEPFSYLFTIEHEIPEWNMAHVASYAELALLMSPRPFMVEAGHRDGGQPTEWVAGEFGKVRRHYDLLKIGDRAEIEFFDGPHTIHGEGTFRFLHRHLNWPTKH